MMFLFCFISCLVCLIVSLVIDVWFDGGWLKVEVMILFLIECCILVIFLGCLLMSMIMRWYFGLFLVIVLVMFCRIVVLFVLGGDIINVCWFLLIGMMRLMIWVVSCLVLVFRWSCWLGYNGVSLLNLGCFLVFLIDLLLMLFRWISGLNFCCWLGCFFFLGICIVLVIVLLWCMLFLCIMFIDIYMLCGLGR